MNTRLGATTLALAAVLALPAAAFAHGGGHGGGGHGGGGHGGGGYHGGGGMHMGGGGYHMAAPHYAAPRMAAPHYAAPHYAAPRMAAPHYAAPRMASPAARGVAPGMAHHAYGGAGMQRNPAMNYSRGFAGVNRGGVGAVNHNFGLARQGAMAGRIGNVNGFNGGRTALVNNNFGNVGGMGGYGNWHRGYWGGNGGRGFGGWGGPGFGGGWGGGGFGGGGLGGFGFGNPFLWGLGSGLGFGLGSSLFGGFGMMGGGFGMMGGGFGMMGGGYGMGGYGMGGYGGGLQGWGLPSWGLGNWPYSYGYSSYMNPYYSGGATASYLDYAQPIAVQTAQAPNQTAADTAAAKFASARDAFKAGDYPTAQRLTDEALQALPNDVDLHEFRALTLFAQGRYSEAAAALYAVLTAGPGWSWATLVGLYPNVDTFTTQLRALEQYNAANPNAASARFVTAYLYITMGETSHAINELRRVVQLQPDDRLSRALLNQLQSVPPAGSQATGSSGTPAATTTAPAEPTPPPPADLTGHWTAQGAGGTSIKLDLQPDGHFTWTTSGQGDQKSFSGTYTSGSGLLTLASGADNLVVVGRLAGAGDDRFRFKLVGGGPNDDGLTFTR